MTQEELTFITGKIDAIKDHVDTKIDELRRDFFSELKTLPCDSHSIEMAVLEQRLSSRFLTLPKILGISALGGLMGGSPTIVRMVTEMLKAFK